MTTTTSDSEPAFSGNSSSVEYVQRLLQRAEERERDPEWQAAKSAEAERERNRKKGEWLTRATAQGFPLREDLRQLVNPYGDGPLTTPAMKLARRMDERLESETVGGKKLPGAAVLAGPVGCGKTVAMAWLWAKRSAGALWVSAPDLTFTGMTSWSANAERWRALRSAELLAVDDLGLEATSASELFASLLLARWADGLLTFGTTNLDRLSFCRRYFGSHMDRIADRLTTENVLGDWWLELPESSLSLRSRTTK